MLFVVEDDRDIAGLLEHQLGAAGFRTKVFDRTSGVIAEALKQRPALFLLDIMLPGGDGTDLCRQIRQSSAIAKTPVIFLTAKNAEADKIAGLEIGADDYITKPFSPRELVARVKAVLRRFESAIPVQNLRIGHIEIDTEAMILRLHGEAVNTTATEFRLLAHLAQNKGKVYTREQLLDSVWRDTAFVTPRSVDVYVRRLREKIEPNPEDPRFLVTVRGAGYRFEDGS